MKLSQALCKQHIGRMFIKHWIVQGKKVPKDTGAIKILKEKNFKVSSPEEVLGISEPINYLEDVPDLKPKPVAFDKTHPNWHDRVCLTYRDDNVLLEGLDQAKIVTKSVQVKEGLPDKFDIKDVKKDVHNKVQDIIKYSHLFDAEQKKLPKIKDPLRPAWNFPRIYGVTDARVNTLLVSKLLNLIEVNTDENIVNTRHVLNNLQFSFPFEKYGELIQFQLRGDTLVTSSTPLPRIIANQPEDELPNLFPIKETITMNRENIYELRDLYPIHKNLKKSNPHTVFVHYNPTEVKNLYEEEVTDTQALGRSLLKAFTVSASFARQKFGDKVGDLPEPITIQCVQTDGRLFDFGVLQLNTLNLEGTEGTKNIWYQTERMPLFTSCTYNLGKPMLEGYNKDIINHLFSFYQNV